MARLPDNTATLLRAAGLDVVEITGWRGRTRPGPFAPVGVLNHHTGSRAQGWTLAKELAYAKWLFLTGRSDLPAPLCQIALGRSGRVYLGAAGRANHAGTAKASGSVAAGDGNARYIGIEWMLSGTEEIPAKMRVAGVRLNAVLTEKITKTSVQTISCHYQTSVTGKWDIGDPNGVPFKGHMVLDVAKFREAVHTERVRLYVPKPAPFRPVGNVVAWNAKVGDRTLFPAQLRDVAKGSQITGLMEVAGHLTDIKAYAKTNKYTVFGTECCILFRNDTDVLRRGIFRTSERWVGPKGRVRRGREIPWIKVRYKGRATLILLVHDVWNPKLNRAAHKGITKLVRGVVAANPNFDVLIMGDLNMKSTDTSAWSWNTTADVIGGKIIKTGAAYDWAIFRPAIKPSAVTAKHPVPKPTGKAGSKHGSDHPAVDYEV